MRSIIVVFIGSGIGGALRHLVGLASLRLMGPNFPYGTLVVNADKNIFATAKTAALAEPSASPAALDTVNVYNHLVSQTTKTGVTPVAGHDAVHMPEHADYHAMAFANDSQFDHHTDMSHLSHLAA